jgi:hypothetical protein
MHLARVTNDLSELRTDAAILQERVASIRVISSASIAKLSDDRARRNPAIFSRSNSRVSLQLDAMAHPASNARSIYE